MSGLLAAIRAGGRRSYKVNEDLTVGEIRNPAGAASWPLFAPGDGAPTRSTRISLSVKSGTL
jgi:hypothetical protein